MSREESTEDQELIFNLEESLKIACDALKKIQTLPSSRDDESSGIAYLALKSIKWGGKK